MTKVRALLRRPSSALFSAAVAAMLSIGNAHALGLGNLEVQSNLEEALSGFIELRVSEGDDIGSVVASIASQEEFESLGIDYPNYLEDISITLESQGADSLLRVSSEGVIISEPFIHFLIKIEWSGGSFLREYTALIDPPSYASETPRSISAPSIVGTDQSFQPDPEPEFDVEEIEAEEIYAEDVADIEEVFDVEPEDVAAVQVEQTFEDSYDQVEDSVAQADDPYDQAEDSYDQVEDSYDQVEDSLVQEEDTGYDDSYESQADIAEIVDQGLSSELDNTYTGSDFPTDAQYGPVTSGESLSVIASELQQQFPDLSIYQIMKVLFDENRASFINENINGLIQGAILNIGDLNAIRAVDIEEGKAFFSQQLSEWDPSYLISSSASGDEAISVGGDDYSFDDDLGFDNSDIDLLSDDQDSFQVGSSSSQDSLVSSSEGGSDSGEVLLLQQQIVDLETSLSSSRLENQEQIERISILEGQLADMNRLMELSVESADLANVEATLAQQNTDPEEAYDVAEEVVDLSENIGTEFDEFDAEFNSADTIADVSEEVDGEISEGLDDALYDDLEEVVDTNEELVDIASDESDGLVGDDGIEEIVDTEPVVSAAPTPKPQATGFMAKAKQTIEETGMLGLGAGLGGLIIAVLGLLVYRRRKADEEFEISMLSIGSESQTIDDLATKSVSQIDVRSAAESGGDRDTSFLTVYTDTDAVVQADEVDPVAEADVYIAYGRDEQAEEVLLDGISNYPSRVDIKHKLLTLYHKNTNVEGFERVAEEAYAQRAELSTDDWEDISRMGKAISPDNPVFELSSEELASSNKAVNEIEDDTDFGEEEAAAASAAAATAADLAANSDSLVDDEPEQPLEAIIEGDDSLSDQLVDDEFAEIEKAVAAAEVSVSDTIEPELNIDDNVDDVVIDAVDEFELVVPSEDVIALDASEEESDDAPEDELPFAEESPSINLINFDDGRSEMSELDEVSIDSLSRADEATINSELTETVVHEPALEPSIDSPTVSGLELDPDYDEARTQYELAKVFVDLGDEDGARKILDEIISNKDNTEQLMQDSQALLDSINT